MLTLQRDLDDLRAGLERWLGRTVGAIARPDPGYSSETLVVEGEMVVRLPPAGDGIFPAYDLAQQAAVQAVTPADGPRFIALSMTATTSFFEIDRSERPRSISCA